MAYSMNNLPEPIKNVKESANSSGQNNYSAALRTCATGGIISLIVALIAISTLFLSGSDAAGPGFFILGFLAIAILVISGFIAILRSLATIVNLQKISKQNSSSPEEIANGIANGIVLIVGIVLVLLVVFSLLKGMM